MVSGNLNGKDDVLPGNDPRWTPAVLERARAVVERDKNHPLIISWSLLKKYQIRWFLKEDGTIIQQGMEEEMKMMIRIFHPEKRKI